MWVFICGDAAAFCLYVVSGVMRRADSGSTCRGPGFESWNIQKTSSTRMSIYSWRKECRPQRTMTFPTHTGIAPCHTTFISLIRISHKLEHLLWNDLVTKGMTPFFFQGTHNFLVWRRESRQFVAVWYQSVMGSLMYFKQCHPHVKSIYRWELMQSPAVRIRHQLPVPLATRCTNPHKLRSTPQHHMVMACTLWVSRALYVRPSSALISKKFQSLD
jgi:hypothetical protein